MAPVLRGVSSAARDARYRELHARVVGADGALSRRRARPPD